MSKLCYEPRSESKLIQQSEIYSVFSSYQDKELKERFQQLKANVCANEPGKGLYPGEISADFHGRRKEIASNV